MIRFCAYCAARLPAAPPVECAACQTTTWTNAKPTASTVLLNAGRFLTVQRAREPAAGRWDLPGFCDGAEHPADAAIRETFEEIGLHVRLGPLIGRLCVVTRAPVGTRRGTPRTLDRFRPSGRAPNRPRAGPCRAIAPSCHRQVACPEGTEANAVVAVGGHAGD